MPLCRSPRCATHLVEHLESCPLMVAPDAAHGKLKYDVPLSEYLWQDTDALHDQALQSGYVQGVSNASLNPESFGGYMLQDSVFCGKATESIRIAAVRATDPDIQLFLEKRLASYAEYTKELFRTWHIDDASGITLGDDCLNYIVHERNVASTMNSVYFVVALIPCAKLWPWIGEQIGADSKDFGVYTEWVKENFNPDSSGVAKYETLVNNAETNGVITREDALQVYRKSMIGEVNFFSSIEMV